MAQSGARQQDVRLAAGIGFFAGIAADMDILIQSENDPLLNIEFHRHFTHSLFFVPLGALLVALVLWPFFRKYLPFLRLYLFTFFGILPEWCSGCIYQLWHPLVVAAQRCTRRMEYHFGHRPGVYADFIDRREHRLPETRIHSCTNWTVTGDTVYVRRLDPAAACSHSSRRVDCGKESSGAIFAGEADARQSGALAFDL